MIVTVGLAGLLSRALDVSNIVNADQSSLASNLAFVVVGGPLLAGITIWLRNSLRENPSEGHGLIPTFIWQQGFVVPPEQETGECSRY